MKSVLHLRSALEIVGSKDPKFDKLVPSPLEFTVLEACIPILEQFDLSSKLLSGQKEPTLQQVIPSLFRIHSMITKVIESNQGCKDFANNLLKNLLFYYPNLGSEMVEYSMAHMLDPVTKGLLLKNLDKYKITQDVILAAHELAPESQSHFHPASSPSLDEEEDPVFQIINSYTRTNPNISAERQTGKSDIRSELDKYLNTPLASRGTKALDYWKLMAHSYPLLAKLARKILCIPASSSASERVFSGSGGTVTCKRTNLHVNNVEKLVYVRENIDFVNL